jgi:N-acetylglucosamine kinase-like BadF-type ATPase
MSSLQISRLACVVLISLAGCGQEKDKKKEANASASAVKTAGDDPELKELIAKKAAESLAEVEAALAKDMPRLTDCIDMVSIADFKAAAPQVAAKLERLCTYDLPMKILSTGTAAAETARAAKPDELTLAACNEPELLIAAEDLEKKGTLDDAGRTLITRLEKACPLLADVRKTRATGNK